MVQRQTSKLTLSVDDGVVRRAKRYARARGTSISRLVERFLALVATDTIKETPRKTRRSCGGYADL